MKKYFIGAITGIMLFLGVGAHAEVSNLIDQVVQGMFPVTVNGQVLGNAIVVDNKTYLPVREFGEAVGYTVTFTEDRQVLLTNTDATPTKTPSTTTSPEPTPPAMTKEQNIDQLKSRIEILKIRIYADKDGINRSPESPLIDLWKESVAKNETELADLQAQLDALLTQP